MRAGSETHHPRNLVGDVWWGFGWGTAYAIVFSAFVACQGVLDGGRAAASHRMSVASVIAVYCITGPTAGLLVGLLRPMIRTTIGTACIGVLAGMVVYGGIGLSKDGWTKNTLVTAVIAGVVVGAPGALLLRARRGGAREQIEEEKL